MGRGPGAGWELQARLLPGLGADQELVPQARAWAVVLAAGSTGPWDEVCSFGGTQAACPTCAVAGVGGVDGGKERPRPPSLLAVAFQEITFPLTLGDSLTFCKHVYSLPQQLKNIFEL